ncbi:hypothetical protein NC653_040517 [Populus alba x Populus x berolinensis]|uniref:Uncharacterized protein n=1 Tax=Populus alba x Populus x berolinensis TaxID=444605 RepID=A0AAD6PPR7_9ROSI|nr:hypothetical protein NC653_040517 [Populus alba x Populus x berolinensis]
MNLCILGKLVLKDFTVEDEAGGAGIALAKTFIATVINFFNNFFSIFT